ncbi:MAG: DUF4982 domain-containing protein [Verrucomicrobia bacterium]|nr:DUF4982 domain-containing protein [Verrucomicrobiota bacterium]
MRFHKISLVLLTLLLNLPARAGSTPAIEIQKNLTVEMAASVQQKHGKATTDKNYGNTDLTIAGTRYERERIELADGWRFLHEDIPMADTGLPPFYAQVKDWVLPARNAFVSTDAALARPVAPAPATPAYARAECDDRAWQAVTVPHDWAITGPFRQDLPGETGKLPWHGVGWYRRTVTLPAPVESERWLLQVDGAMSFSTVWLNGQLVGGWPYGYSTYQLDLTPYARAGSNTLAFRLESPPNSSRWYPGAGLYRNVWLLRTPALGVAQWGTHVTTTALTDTEATLRVEATVANTTAQDASVRVRTVIRDGQREVAASAALDVPVTAGGQSLTRTPVTLPNPIAWQPGRAHLYTAVTTVEQGGREVDRYETPFGVRTLSFTGDGFKLNGQRVILQGVCNHHDLGALGAAFNVRAAERQLEILQEMGVNALRTSHNPPAPELLDLCDRMGILVMDESFDCWKKGKKSQDYSLLWDDWSEADLRALVRRDRNHPSVIMWSVGNEVPDQGTPEGPAIAARLRDLVRLEDTTRPVTAGMDRVISAYNGMAANLGLMGFNYKPFEYARHHLENPDLPVYGSETASTVSSRGVYFFPVAERILAARSDYQVSSYDLHVTNWSNLPDHDFAAEDRNPFVFGQFVWTGFDYLGEPSPHDHRYLRILPRFTDPVLRAEAERQLKEKKRVAVPSRSSYFGIVDLAGFKKDRFFLYQSRWRPDYAMAHLLPHWNWPERVGEVTPVFLYTTGDEAELFLNGRSLGRRTKAKLAPLPVNLAVGKPTTASVEVESAALVTDGRTETTWKSTAVRTPAWWQVDLGAVTELQALRVDFGRTASSYSYRIVSSADAQTWTPVAISNGEEGDMTWVDYAVSLKARYLRVEFTADNLTAPELKELAAFAIPLPVDIDVYRLRWNDVVYQPGELKAVVYRQGKPWAEAVMRTAGAASQLTLAADRPDFRADGKDLCYVTITVADAEGRLVPRTSHRLHVEVSGAGELVAMDNGDATSHESFQGPDHQAWNGLCLAIIRGRSGQTGPITIAVTSPGLAPATLTLTPNL